MQKILIIINDSPYGAEKAYNALRMAKTLQEEPLGEVDVKIFLVSDGVYCGLINQEADNNNYDIEKMLKTVIKNGGEVKTCSGCAKSRGIYELQFIEGVKRSNMKEFALWTYESDKVLNF